ncbi:intermembrane phospholipid transport protein YdbH family protein [Brevundimonas viscosa]|uniref:Dicarboxylate transport n=1 Tax=Brevundimonas viscosa TaxID=871741 RepID=A0A1I6P4V7_9CAUL|nr:YdbH domain-containing protein [Brevundimonas viscosa]SFS35110.1 Dicarboxylate transport [Brevundimonas viscosa]
MSEPAPPAPVRPARGGSRRSRVLDVLLVVLGVLLVLIALLYLNRRAATRQVLVGWLEQQGIEAEMEVERVEIDSLVASLRVGDADDPDVVVERVEVDFSIGAPWSAQGLGVTPGRIRLLRPVVRARLADGKLSFGSLDPLIERFAARPPRPDVRGPLVLVERGVVRLATDFGPAEVHGDARIDDGKLMRLVARMPAADLRSGDIAARRLGASIDLTTVGDRVTLRAGAVAASAELPGVAGEGLRLGLAGELPYPDLKTRRGDGRARLRAQLSADRLAGADSAARRLAGTLDFDGATAGWLESFRIEGVSDLDLRAGGLAGPAAATAPRLRLVRARTHLSRDSNGVGWRLDGDAVVAAGNVSAAGVDAVDLDIVAPGLTVGGRGRAVETSGPLRLAAARVDWGDLTLRQVRSAAALDMIADAGLRVGLEGRLQAAHGAWPLFGPPSSGDLPDLAAMKQALGDFAVEAPAFRLAAGSSGTRLVLAAPARIRPANGGVLTLAPAGAPIFAAAAGEAGGGAFSLAATRGRGLPEAEFDVPRWRLAPGGFAATLDGRAALDFDLGRGIRLETRGELASDGGRLTYTAAGCAPVSVERLELGENDVTDLSGALCPADRPLLTAQGGAWRSDARLQGLDADAPFLALGVRKAEGGLVAVGGGRGVDLDLRADDATLVDTTTPARFNPLGAVGAASLRGQNWSGAFDLSREGTTLGRLTLAHDGRAGAGGVTIDAPSIVFAEGGLQPADLSPLAGDFVGSPATGSVAFEGRVDWREGSEGSSRGRLTIPGLDFVSPAGPVQGLRGTVDFTSLAPLVAAPGQRLTADRLESVAPLTDIELVFGLDQAAVTIEGGDLAAAGGVLRVEPFAVPLDRSQPFGGVLVLENVQLGEVIAGAGFEDKVRLDAVVSGRLPFTWDPAAGLRIAGGTLYAVQPGRLSIQREALSGLEAGGGGEAVPPNTVQDLAYQAMENLSFDILSAEVNSLDEGRLNVLFRIRGRHDPPQRQELRVSIAEFISREFLNRELPLPSGTGIDLTLDTTLNANQLVGDLLELNRARNGEADPTP